MEHDNNLKNFVDNIAENSHLRIESDLGDGYFRLRATEAQRRQAKQDIRCVEDIVIETLRNSRDANAKNIFLAVNNEDNFRNILIIDDGDGIPKSHHNLIFEPYVTSKLDNMTTDIWGVHGRGMALYSISVNTDKAYVVNSEIEIGCAILIKIKIGQLNEKKDQSTFPNFYINEDAELVVRGPKNILRTACEFAVENRDRVNVYIGSPAEIASTLYFFSKKNKKVKAVFDEPNDNTKLMNILSYSSDVHDFKKYAEKLGILISKRTARRIMDCQIKPQKSILERIADKGIKSNSNKAAINNKKYLDFDIFDIKCIHKAKPKKLNIKLDNEDKQQLLNSIKKQFTTIANKYYLKSEIEPNILIKNNKISISFDIVES